jgi:hypothetical protein
MSQSDLKAPPPGTDASCTSTARSEAEVDRAVRLYRDLGFSEERAAITLARTGYPVIKSVRYPTVSVQPDPGQLRRARARAPVAGQGGAGNRSVAGEISQTVPSHCVAPGMWYVSRLRQLSSQTPAKPHATHGNAISFSTCPLIQCSFPRGSGRAHDLLWRNGWLELTLSTARKDSACRMASRRDCYDLLCERAIRTRSPEIYPGEASTTS